MATRILISDPVDSVCADFLQKHGFTVDQVKVTKEQLLGVINEYDGLIVRSETKVTADILAAGTRLKVVGRAGTGVDNVDLEAATARGILVMNTPGGNTLSAAEHTCALIASMARNIPQASASLKTMAWERKAYGGNELYGKTLAILGLGRIGKEVALRMQSYGMKTIGYDPIIPAEVTAAFGVKSMTTEEIWPQADYITVHVPLIPQTKHLINDAVFAKCKKGVRVVNVARGGIIEEAALLRALKSGACGGAALDVFVEEPPKSEHYKELLAHPKMVCTPHLGASTTEAQLRVAEEIAEQFVTFFRGEGLNGAINAGPLSQAMTPENRPLLILARSLGIAASIFGPATKLSVAATGLNLKNGWLGSAVVSGFICGLTGDANVNLINGPALAKAKGIEVAVTEGPQGNTTSVSVLVNGHTLIGEVGSTTVAGLKSIDGGDFAGGLPLDGPLLFFTAPELKSFAAFEGVLVNNKLVASSVFRSTNGQVYVARTGTPFVGTVAVETPAPFKFIAGRNF